MGATISSTIERLAELARAAGVVPPDSDASGAELRAAREALGLARGRAGELLGASEHAVWAWESGVRRPGRATITQTIERLTELASAAGAEPDPRLALGAAADASGAELRAAREALGLTQKRAGELLGSSRDAVSNWEAGSARPRGATISSTIERLIELARAAGVVAPGEDASGEELRAARLRLGMTQRRAGDLLGASQTTIMRWESGSTRPRGATITQTIERLAELARAAR